ncbi:motility associated factor glycosyltransferase family protein, partial [Campylobacter jejuni]|nr:motility associated factor glycosyltransferase family protein [Campylobacter jejuni]
TLRGAFAYRGKMIADVLKLHIQDKTHFITAYIKAYHEWLLYFIEKLEQKYKSLSKVCVGGKIKCNHRKIK